MKTIHRLSSKNRKILEDSFFVGCFYCTLVLGPHSIEKWTDDDDTAICPMCGVDSMIPLPDGDKAEMVTLLNQIKESYFK